MAADKQKIDSDILKGKEDILRAKKAAETKTPSEPTPLMSAVVQANKAKTERKDEHIPSFNVANRILSNQRKTSSEKRKSPSQKNDIIQISPQISELPELKPTSAPAAARVFTVSTERKESFSSFPPTSPSRSGIISEIVARDIKNFCLRKPAFV